MKAACTLSQDAKRHLARSSFQSDAWDRGGIRRLS